MENNQNNKNLKFLDFHIHLSEIKEDFSKTTFKNIIFFTTIFSEEEYTTILKLKKQHNLNILISFGIHPLIKQKTENDLLYFVKNSKIDAIGEFGFDFFNNINIEEKKIQKQIFETQLNIALTYNLPIILHLRKSINEIFYYKKELKSLPAILFHSFSGTINDVNFFLKNNINAYFSFGTALLNNHKKTIETFKKIPLSKIFLETDAPYQPKFGEKINKITTIYEIYKKAGFLKNKKIEEIQQQLIDNSFKFSKKFYSFYNY